MPNVRTNDIETYYEQRGDGPPVVFIHAAIMNHSQCTPQADALSEEYTIIAYDVRGHGRAGGSARDPYSIDLFAEDLGALIAALDVERPVLCGFSAGGCIAQTYTATHLENIAGLVLADTFTPEMSTVGERLAMTALKATILPVRLVGYELVQRINADLRAVQQGRQWDYDEVDRLQAQAPTIATDEFVKIIRALTSFPDSKIDHLIISVPTLVLYGENVPAFLQRQAGKLAAVIPDASIQAVPNAGHASNFDDPEFFTAAIGEFLVGVDRRDTTDGADELEA